MADDGRASTDGRNGPDSSVVSIAAWETEAEFRASDSRRGGPVTVEFGSRWFGSVEEDPWRLCWLEATGELVVIQLGVDGFDGPVRCLALLRSRASVERLLRGWWQVCGHRGSLPWAERRAAEAAPAPTGDPLA